MIAVSATFGIAACSQEEDIVGGSTGDNKLVFTVGAATRSEVSAALPVAGATISAGKTENGLGFYLEETVSSLDDPSFFTVAETRGTPVYTQNFLNISGGSFKGAAFPVAAMTKGKITDAVYPKGAWADFTNKGEFWEHSYEWNPWYDQNALLFYGKMLKEATITDPSVDNQKPIGVLPNSYLFLNDDTAGQRMTFSYRSPLTAQDQQDILFAARTITKQEAKKAVPILFYHALTGVKFATAYANEDDVKTYIKKVEFTGLYGYGKCTVKSVAEGGDYVDVANTHSSKDAVSWDLSENGVNTLTTVYSQEFPEASVTYTGGSFTSKGDYPDSFSAAGNKQNLNDGDATMTFWFPPQTITSGMKLKVTFDIEVKGKRTEYTLDLDMGARLAGSKWEAGQIRTFTLKPDEVDVEIEDKVSGFEKTDIKITNTGNVDAFIRAMIVANWWGTASGDLGIATGYTSSAHNAYVNMWKRTSLTGDNYGGVFEGLPGDNWVLAQDGYFYYKNKVAPGEETGDKFFIKYSLDTEAHPVPEIWYLDGELKQYENVFLRMEIPVQAIEAKEGKTWQQAWSEAGVNVVL